MWLYVLVVAVLVAVAADAMMSVALKPVGSPVALDILHSLTAVRIFSNSLEMVSDLQWHRFLFRY